MRGSVELLRQLVEWAKKNGFEVREEWLGGVAAGACRIKGKNVLFMDISLPPAERLEQALQSLESIGAELDKLPEPLRVAAKQMALAGSAAAARSSDHCY